MGNTPSDSSSSPGDIWDIWERDDAEEARLLREAAGGGAGKQTSTTVSVDTTGGISQTGADATTSAAPKEEDVFEPDISVCGLVAGGEWVVPEPAPRIKESALTVAEKAKMRAHLAIIFSDDAVLGKRLVFDPYDVIEVMKMVVPYLKSEPMLIEDVPFDVAIVADIHGQLHDLHRIFDGDAKDGKPGWECQKYVFLGDYVDRGRQSLEVVMALFCIKILYPDRIFLLRGNHEFIAANIRYGFPLEIQERYTNLKTATMIYAHANTAFCYLSCAAIVGNIYLCVHAGVSPAGYTRELLRGIPKPYVNSQDNVVLHDTMWADPANGLRGTTFNVSRGTSHYYGIDTMAYALNSLDCVLLFRGHSCLEAGYEIVGDICVSLFSAVGSSGTNKGAVAYVDATGAVEMCVFEVDVKRLLWEAELLRLDGANPTFVDETTVYADVEIEPGTIQNLGNK